MNAKDYLNHVLPNQHTFGINQVISLLENFANQPKWISVETLPEKKQVRYQCLAEVHPRKESFYQNNYAIVQDWVIRKHPENFIKYKPLSELK